ncbi:MAG: hypothetical protein ACLUOJ_01345 [Streptococcus salivarius]
MGQHLDFMPSYLFGGILFHLISETKSQYTLPYIYLQIPMIAAGY